MKTKFHTGLFAQVFLALAALIFTQCSKPPGDVSGGAPASSSGGAPAGNPVALISEGASPAFRAVASHLELGGRSYGYSEADAAPALAAFLDQIMQALPASERKDIPAGFTFAKLFRLLGLNAVTATGSSSRARADGSFHSRSFSLMPDGRKGLMTLSGGPAAKLLALDFAPKDTDFALEFPLHFNEFARDNLPEILAMIPAAERADFEREMSQPVPPLGLSGRQMIEKLDARVGIFLRLDPTQKFQPTPAAPVLPGADGVIVIERLGWLVEALKPQFMPALSQPGLPVTFTDENGVLTVRMKSPAGPPPMDFQPVVRFDAKADRILIATRPAVFDAVVAGAEKITQNADFAQAWRDLPDEGNLCLYASPRLLQTVSGIAGKAAQSAGTSNADAAVTGKMFDWLKPLASRGQAIVFVNQPDGALTLVNASIPMAASPLPTVAVVSLLAAIAVPNFVRARERALEVTEFNDLRQVQLSLKMYAGDHEGKYPAALAELSPQYGLTDQIVMHTDRRTKQRTPWLYRNSLTDTSPATEVLLAAPVPSANRTRAVGFNDGSVKLIPEAEFQALWQRK